MVKSMTGYGKGECTLSDHSKITVEIKSLNGKNADINFKSQIIPKDKELEIRKLLSEKLVRGSIEFSVTQEMKTGAVRRVINEPLAKSLLLQAKKVAGAKADESALLAAILRMPEVLESKENKLSAADMAKIDKAIDAAIKKIDNYREAEGKALYKDVTKRVATILKCLEQVKKEDIKRVPAIKERLRQKVEKSGIAVDNNRLEQEIVFYVEKLDINEEKVRLAQHCKYFMVSTTIVSNF